MTTAQVDIGSRIRRHRERRAWKQSDLLAELPTSLGLQQGTFSKIENGSRAVKSHELHAIARALNVDPLSLLEDDPLDDALDGGRNHHGAVDAAIDRARFVARLNRSIGLDACGPFAGVEGHPPGELASWVRERAGIADGEKVADSLDLNEQFCLFGVVEDFGPGFDGLHFRDGGFALAVISSHGDSNRQRFIAAHQLFHHLIGGERMHVDTDVYNPGESGDETGQLANKFARDLLAPVEAVAARLRDHTGDRLEQVIDAIRIGFIYGVSPRTVADQIEASVDTLDVPAGLPEFLRQSPYGLAKTAEMLVEYHAVGRGRHSFAVSAGLEDQTIEAYQDGRIGPGPLAGLLKLESDAVERRFDTQVERDLQLLLTS